MYCTNCGKQIPNKSKFWPQCGQKIILHKIRNNLKSKLPHRKRWGILK